jgi:hypothetical protein
MKWLTSQPAKLSRPTHNDDGNTQLQVGLPTQGVLYYCPSSHLNRSFTSEFHEPELVLCLSQVYFRPELGVARIQTYSNREAN